MVCRRNVALSLALAVMMYVVGAAAAAAGAIDRSVEGASLPSGPADPVTVFHLGEAGYYCMKIPYILTTSSGTLLAFAEARKPDCSDYTWTDLVMKRSLDNGNTWGELSVVYSNSTEHQFEVIGNAGPVQDSSTGRIWFPFCRNNSQIFVTHSDDDGVTWAAPTDISAQVVHPDWKWVGIGPPAGLQLSNGRLLWPCYHAPFHDLDGTFTHPHVMVSDDHGKTWNISFAFDYATDKLFGNENQAVELQPGSVLISSRTLGTHRGQAVSHDNGDSFGDLTAVEALPEPFDGVEGSIVKHPKTQWLFLSNPNEDSIVALRYNMTIKISKDYGNTWVAARQLDKGPSGYSALTVAPDDNIGILYERSNVTQLIFLPLNISYQVAWDFNSADGSPLPAL